MPPVWVALIPIALTLAAVLYATLRSRRRAKKPRSGREPSATIVLEGNLWDACAVDDVQAPWSRYTTEAVRGFCGVPAGRHRFVTTTPAGLATLDVVIYPGEVLSWHLDVERARWEPHDLDADTKAVLDGSPLSGQELGGANKSKVPGWLVHLRASTGTRHRLGALDEGTDRLRKRLVKLVARAEGDAKEDALLVEARAIGEAIIGKALARRELRAIVAAAREVAMRHLGHGDPDRAMLVLSLGLAVLPGDPELTVVAGCALAARGETDEALRALNAALERDRCLEAEDVARAMRARMELRSRHGLPVRV